MFLPLTEVFLPYTLHSSDTRIEKYKMKVIEQYEKRAKIGKASKVNPVYHS